jgi:hypothetical protein
MHKQVVHLLVVDLDVLDLCVEAIRESLLCKCATKKVLNVGLKLI